MKCISLWQPWASLVAIGAKKIETRSWSTKYRGPLAIHAAQKYSMETAAFAGTVLCESVLRLDGLRWAILPRGYIIAICELVDVLPTTHDSVRPSRTEANFGNYAPGRFAWLLSKIIALPTPIKCRGRQGLFNVEIPA